MTTCSGDMQLRSTTVQRGTCDGGCNSPWSAWVANVLAYSQRNHSDIARGSARTIAIRR
jgi:hypothetical protein